MPRDLTRPDVRAAATLLADAFEQAAVASGIFPSDAARRPVLAAMFATTLTECLARGARLREDHAYLTLLAVADRARGKCLARVLLEDVLAHAEAHSQPVHLECEPHPAGLYQSFGFTRTGTL